MKEHDEVQKETAAAHTASHESAVKNEQAQEATNVPVKRSSTIRKWFFYILIGGLIISAVISIIAVLIGEVNDVVARSLWTTVIMVVHSLIAVALLTAASNEKNSTADEVALNVLVGLTVASFVTAALGTWEVLSGAVVGDLYRLMFYALFTDVLIFILLHSRFSDSAIARSAKVSIGITVAFFIYLIPSVFTGSLDYVMPDIYNRGIAAFSILLSTSVVITIIYHWVYTLKHRDERVREQAEAIARGEQAPVVAAPVNSPMPTWLKVLLIVIVAIFGLPILLGVLGGIILTMSRFF